VEGVVVDLTMTAGAMICVSNQVIVAVIGRKFAVMFKLQMELALKL